MYPVLGSNSATHGDGSVGSSFRSGGRDILPSCCARRDVWHVCTSSSKCTSMQLHVWWEVVHTRCERRHHHDFETTGPEGRRRTRAAEDRRKWRGKKRRKGQVLCGERWRVHDRRGPYAKRKRRIKIFNILCGECTSSFDVEEASGPRPSSDRIDIIRLTLLSSSRRGSHPQAPTDPLRGRWRSRSRPGEAILVGTRRFFQRLSARTTRGDGVSSHDVRRPWRRPGRTCAWQRAAEVPQQEQEQEQEPVRRRVLVCIVAGASDDEWRWLTTSS